MLSMQIRVKFFALVRERAGRGELLLNVGDGATVADALVRLGEQVPAVAELLPRCAFAVNRSYAQRDHALREGDELAVIPPVSGG